MTMVRVNSSAIDAVGYEDGTLRVRFNNGRTYDHPGVPHSVYLGLLNADSVGRFYNERIRGRY